MQTADAFIASYIPRWEGAPGHYLSVDPNDAGNWSSGTKHVGTLIGSNYGVTYRTLKAYRGREVTAADMKALTLGGGLRDRQGAVLRRPASRSARMEPGDRQPCSTSVGARAPDAAIKTLQNMLDVTQDGVIGTRRRDRQGVRRDDRGAWRASSPPAPGGRCARPITRR